jgi:hypothetical protein
MFLQNQNAQNLSEKQRHSSIYHSTQRSEEASKQGAYKIDHHTEAEVVVAPLENHVKNEQFDLKSPPHLPHDSSAFKSSYHPHFFDFRVDKKFHLTNLNKRNRFIRPWDFHQDQFGCLRDRFNVIVFFILVANLYSMALEIFVGLIYPCSSSISFPREIDIDLLLLPSFDNSSNHASGIMVKGLQIFGASYSS